MEPSRENCKKLIELIRQERQDIEFPCPILADIEKFLEEAAYWLPPQRAIDQVNAHKARRELGMSGEV